MREVVEKEPERTSGARQSQSESDRRDSEDFGCLRSSHVLEDREPKGFLMNFREKHPGAAQIDTASDQVSVRGAEEIGRYISEADAQRLASLFPSSCIQQEVACDPENPSPGIIFAGWCFGEAPPDDKEGLCYDVFGICRLSTPLNKPQQVGVCGFVQ